ncbi:MAG: phenylalanine--tRNA ligase subunit alpha [Chloroflexi bacterium]|nr:phenylalanine--tRNA ligase subunit alpha [Chloroflexota bacterium]
MALNLRELQEQALRELASLSDSEGLEAWRVRYLGRKGALPQFLRGLGSLSLEERKTLGAQANQLKDSLLEALEKRLGEIRSQALSVLHREAFDITQPGRPFPMGRLHPITQVVREVCAIFSSLGFQVVEGPEVEWDYYNFEALNIPPEHPARDMFSTFWIDFAGEKGRNMLLRTHTSPMQIRVMEKTAPPVRVVVPGKVFRYEATDATHEAMFHQVEGLAVDRGITMADLKGTLFEFVRLLFGEERKARFRCTYFPFVEPGVDMAIDCFLCKGQGCRVCGHSGWLEVLGAGMVHPEVLDRVGYDSRVYTGFAFGMGVERLAMLRWGIEDIRLFFQNDIRFLRQF